jgi:hypothetical protein
VRSILDPLPRFLTVRGLAVVVGMLVLGTAISVHEFLESARPPVRHASGSPIRNERASEPVPELGARRANDASGSREIRRFTGAPGSRDTIPSSAAPAPEPAPAAPAPSVWEPDDPHSGR